MLCKHQKFKDTNQYSGQYVVVYNCFIIKEKCVAGLIAQLVLVRQSWVRVMVRQFQSGFRSGFSTDTCLIHVTDCIKFEMDNGSIA
jgi:hypothetical protein